MLAVRFHLFTIVVAQLADAFTFTIGVSRFGIELETKRIASGLFQAGGFAAILSMKGVVLVVTVSLLAATAARFPRLLT